jgi:hypothetical protein
MPDPAAAVAGGGGPAVDPSAVARPGGARPLGPGHEQIARTGQFDRARYPTPSHARQGVLAAAAARGWSLADVQATLAGGAWPGLAGLYGRYAPRHRARSLARDWTKALTWARRPVANSDTGVHPTHAPVADDHEPDDHNLATARTDRPLSDYVHVRVWRTAADLATPQRYAGRAGISKRAVLVALSEAGHRRGTRYVDVGCRSLGLGAAVDHATAAEVLRSLRDEPDPFIVLIEDQRGERGDLYELRIPDAHREAAEALPWRRGRLTGLHPVFHRLGVPAALLLDAIERTGPADPAALVDASGLSRATVYRAAAQLAVHGLLTRTGARWRRTRLRLDALARRLGVPALVDALLTRIRAERLAWRALMGIARGLSPDPIASLAELADLPLPPDPGPDPPPTPLELLYRVLGAVPLVPS